MIPRFHHLRLLYLGFSAVQMVIYFHYITFISFSSAPLFGVSVWRYPPRLSLSSFMDLEVQDSQMSLNGNFEQRERATKHLIFYCFITFIIFFNTWLSGSEGIF